MIKIEVIKSTSLRIQENVILEITIMLRNIKVLLLSSEKIFFFIFFNENPLKTTKNDFYFTL